MNQFCTVQNALISPFLAVQNFAPDSAEFRAALQTNQLREMEADGLLTRTVFAEVPPRVEYTITDKGRSLIPILLLMCDWGYENMGDRYTLLRPECD